MTVSAKSLAPSHLEQEPEIWQGTAEGSGCAFCHLHPALPRWGSMEIWVLTIRQLSQATPTKAAAGSPAWTEEQTKPGEALEREKQVGKGAEAAQGRHSTAVPSPAPAGTISGCSPQRIPAPHMQRSCRGRACVVHPDLCASQRSQMRSAWFHGGARFSENHGNYTCKKNSLNTRLGGIYAASSQLHHTYSP